MKKLIISIIMFLPISLLAHGGSLSKAPWSACDKKVESNICQFTNHHGDEYRGVCKLVSAHLICARNQPIIKKITKSALLKKRDSKKVL